MPQATPTSSLGPSPRSLWERRHKQEENQPLALGCTPYPRPLPRSSCQSCSKPVEAPPTAPFPGPQALIHEGCGLWSSMPTSGGGIGLCGRRGSSIMCVLRSWGTPGQAGTWPRDTLLLPGGLPAVWGQINHLLQLQLHWAPLPLTSQTTPFYRIRPCPRHAPGPTHLPHSSLCFLPHFRCSIPSPKQVSQSACFRYHLLQEAFPDLLPPTPTSQISCTK